MKNIADSEFGAEVLKSDLPVLVDFWAPWCGPCQMLGPIVEAVAAEFKGKIRVVKINIDENQVVANQYKIMSVPMLLFFKGGQIVDSIIGVVPKEAITSKINSLFK